MKKEKANNEAMLEYIILNGKIKSTNEINPMEIAKKLPIYEVVKIKEGAALYIEEHIGRMKKSAELMGVKLEMDDIEIKEHIKRLIEANGEHNMNVKLLASNFTDEGFDFAAYFIKSFYPPVNMYEEGIHTILYRSERENPHAKVVNIEQREGINRKREKEAAFEAILVNEKGYLTEGSRSNIFFVKDSKVHTPPSGDVLLGITRKKVLEICCENEIGVEEHEIPVESIKEYDGAFITGTSINVLPVATIDDMKLHSTTNEVVKLLVEKMNENVSEYIKSCKL
ncbi:branched-chain amino acid aminotransferase [Peptoclostridium litorale DSM 5388]|uniref:Branched-chain amino acid aminotransferase n=1 Tax=Peptoclostridium litorale DSM 5388 TaxID=1121324 RepID=A0A069RD70_PEPLI|nr:aminotransferase class IV [Peptoclostridium litorale]KDR94986.1 branched-chain amino acid aminotransferase [Peptoclostridium litorale DSM 5388]SIN77019.1 branched-chain amino acid aminotransferase [Peptoclostridium litorale DSM 5388]